MEYVCIHTLGQDHLRISMINVPMMGARTMEIKIPNFSGFPTEKFEAIGLVVDKNSSLVSGEGSDAAYRSLCLFEDRIGKNLFKEIMEDTIILIDAIAPIPDAIKIKIITDFELNASRLNLLEDRQIPQADKIYYATHLKNRVNYSCVPPEEAWCNEKKSMYVPHKEALPSEERSATSKKEFLKEFLDKNQPGEKKEFQEQVSEGKGDDRMHL